MDKTFDQTLAIHSITSNYVLMLQLPVIILHNLEKTHFVNYEENIRNNSKNKNYVFCVSVWEDGQ